MVNFSTLHLHEDGNTKIVVVVVHSFASAKEGRTPSAITFSKGNTIFLNIDAIFIFFRDLLCPSPTDFLAFLLRLEVIVITITSTVHERLTRTFTLVVIPPPQGFEASPNFKILVTHRWRLSRVCCDFCCGFSRCDFCRRYWSARQNALLNSVVQIPNKGSQSKFNIRLTRNVARC